VRRVFGILASPGRVLARKATRRSAAAVRLSPWDQAALEAWTGTVPGE